ncbi:MAG: tetratricopeptide repeat protein [Pseudomonadota bacterium]|nr:tetratricopeptide repeat protein [Pseudomonadota bacterium]
MSELRTDEEQAELIKKWWSENGSSVVTTVAVAVAGVVGWNFWQDQKQATGEAASATYSQLVQLAAQENDAVQGEMQTLAEQLKSEYADTAYADFGSLFIARLAADNGDYDAAAAELRGLIASADSEAVRQTATARLAAVLIQQDKADEALAVLPETADAAYAPQIEEARGDALYLKGELNNARDAYLRAMDAAQTLGQTNTTLQRKIDTLVAAGDA